VRAKTLKVLLVKRYQLQIVSLFWNLQYIFLEVVFGGGSIGPGVSSSDKKTKIKSNFLNVFIYFSFNKFTGKFG